MKYDIIIQGGQSNADGTGRGPVSCELAPMSDVWYVEAEKRIEFPENGMLIFYADKPLQIVPAQERMVDGEITGDFSLTFAEMYKKAGLLEEDRQLLIVRAAIGGTGFMRKQWGLGNLLHNKLVEMTDYALSLGEDCRVVGFLWHQGEHDAFEKNEPDTYYGQLMQTVADVRARYGVDIPFVAGDFVNEWKTKNIESCAPIVAKIREAVAAMGNAAFVETADLRSNNQEIGNGDDIHFSRESLHVLGRRYFQAFSSIFKH